MTKNRVHAYAGRSTFLAVPFLILLFSVVLFSRATGKNVSIEPVELTKRLIEFPTIFPDDKGSLNFLQNLLQLLGFRCEITETGEPDYRVRNLYARLGIRKPNLCFIGHVDVVPPGDVRYWKFPPYEARIQDGVLYGRGAVDMKSAIAAFVAAVSKLIDKRRTIDGSLSLIITSNEEGPKNEYGTDSVLKLLAGRGETIDFALIGEPTSEKRLGDMIKIGRRGSISFQLKVYGKQGHVAYHELADNPIHRMLDILQEVKNTVLDNGTEYFQPSNCEVISIDVRNTANNVIPGDVTSRINIRYNTLHSADSLTKLIRTICERYARGKYELSTSSVGGGAFLNKDNRYTGLLVDILTKCIEGGVKPKLSTTGGTSDARFVRNYCSLVEFGLVSKTAHQYDENTPVEDIYKLTDIYETFIVEFFSAS